MDITGYTKFTGLIGTPIRHSISPQMHNEAFRLLGLDYVYLAFEMQGSDLKTTVEGLKQLGISGFNVTMPFKSAIVEYMDDLTPASQIAGACNTVIVKDGQFTGHTTDGIGFMQSVKDAGYDVIGKKMAILGAGGAATAIITQAALDGVKQIDIYRRNRKEAFAKTERFAQKVQEATSCVVRVYDIADTKWMKSDLEDTTLLINATNAGMVPNTELTPLSDPSVLHPDLIVSDIIYQPRTTRFLAEASQIGCRTFNGMYMVLFQGAASFECWTGQKMPIESIRQKYFS